MTSIFYLDVATIGQSKHQAVMKDPALTGGQTAGAIAAPHADEDGNIGTNIFCFDATV